MTSKTITMKNDVPVLIVGNFLSGSTGSRGVCEDLAERLVRAGWSVVTTSNKLNRIIRLLDMLTTVWGKRRQYRIALIDTFSGPAFFWAEVVSFALRSLRKPYVLTLHGGNLPAFAQRWPGRITRLLKSAAAVTAPSRYLLEQMKPYRPDILLVPNPIDVQKYSFKLRSVSQPTLVWLRAFHEIYNAPLAIRVAAKLVPKYPRFRLLMGGGDMGDDSLKKTMQLVETLSISEAIEFAGKIPKVDVPDWLQGGDIFINTTNIDNTPVSVIEAMACGLCVVSTNVGGIPYLLDDEKNALLVPPNDSDAMACAVLRVMAEPGLSARLSENGRRLAEQSDWEYIYPMWKKIFESILD
jgi:glycosyltransferase involved in cell wall biosynthesis